MRHTTRAVLCLITICLAGASVAWTPWGAIYESARDERSVSQQADDKRISLDIKSQLADRDGKKALKVHVYCFMGRVYLVGAIDDTDFRKFAVKTAKSIKGNKGVTTHFVKETDTTADDLEVAASVRAALIAEGDLSATQIETETMNGEVVMVGMVRSKADAKLAIKVAKGVEGVRKVTSYLIPPK
ncbi:BON domain-containing protein [Pseudodesulfovibrio cashew]|uniref:BON domain-containing protein n=1 Tax=Pseudodesulfovibrio cashew TaxID=2678688 RepID=A0A6I6JVH0_9BACT|nr:BON domain-containing protein [Pseudodesulfovibrio cashew]QGY41694.1 BON domain-containing protein [Pseudodesulfovibrio cashew]